MARSREALASLGKNGDPRNEPAYRFYKAASAHRWFVFRELLPANGIVVI